MHSTCPHCCGRGTTEVLATGQDTYDRPVSRWLTMRCHTCAGIGIVTAERIATLDRGRRLRDERVRQGLTQAEMARCAACGLDTGGGRR